MNTGINKSYAIISVEELSHRLKMPLPGKEAHMKLAPSAIRDESFWKQRSDAQISCVLLMLYPFQDQDYLVFIHRSEYEGVHSGQISLPGGKVEKDDSSLEYTALREAHEEIGIEMEQVRILGTLSPFYISRSNYLVYPFVGFIDNKPQFIADPSEVQEVLEIPLQHLMKEENIVHQDLHLANHQVLNVPGYSYQGHFIWGATAMILSEFISVLKA